MTTEPTTTDSPENSAEVGIDVQRLVRQLRSKAEREWRAIWREYPHHKRTDEERQIVLDEQIRINGYIEALDDILANS